MSDISLHEIFTKVEEAQKVATKAEILQQHESDGLKAVLRGAYDSRVQWNIPSTPPPYEPHDAPDWDLADLHLEQEALRIGRFANFNNRPTNQSRNITQVQAENQFIQLLEGLHPTEATLLLNVVKKKLPYKGLTSRLVNQAFPDLLPEKDALARK
jgi:hypothetical protein